MKIHSVRGFKMISWAIIPTIIVTKYPIIYGDKVKWMVLTLRFLKFAMAIRLEY